MAKDALTDFSTTASSNEDIGGIAILGTSPKSNFDNAFRELMSQLADALAGTAPVYDTFTYGDPANLQKRFRFDAGLVTSEQTRVLAVPNYDGTLATLAGIETLTNKTLVSPTFSSVTAPTFLNNVAITSTSATATGAQLFTYQNSASPAISDIIGEWVAQGKDSAGNADTYGHIRHVITDPTSTSEDSVWAFLTRVAGSLTERLRIGAGLYMQGATGEDKGAGTINATAVYANGLRLGVGGAPDAVMEDQKAQNTSGGTFTSGAWRTRDLNTEVRDPDGLVSISSNEFTFTVAGWVEWDAPASRVNNHQSRLYNVTDASVAGYSQVAYLENAHFPTGLSTGGAAVMAGKAYRIEHRCDTTVSGYGFGGAANFGTEVYTRVKFWRTA